MRKSNIFWGLLLVMLGLLFLFNRFFSFLSINNLWPLFVLVPGLVFELGYFTSRKDPGVLVPGGILTTIGLLFLFETATNWTHSEYTWPVYPLSVAIGLFQLYLFSGRNSGLLIPVAILGGVSLVAFISMLFGSLLSWVNLGLVLPVVLIALGLIIIFKRK